MGRKRLDRKVVTYSIARSTVKRIDELRNEKQERLKMRPTAVTISEVIDEAIAYFYTLRIQEVWVYCPECRAENGFILKPKQLMGHHTPTWRCNSCHHAFIPMEAESMPE